MFPLYIVWCPHDSVFSFVWMADWTADVRASLAHHVGDAVGGGNWAAAGDSADADPEARETSDRVCQCAPDSAQPCAVRAAAAGAVAGGERGAAGDSCAHGVCLAADSAEHVCRDQQCRPGVDRCSQCIRHEQHAETYES